MARLYRALKISRRRRLQCPRIPPHDGRSVSPEWGQPGGPSADLGTHLHNDNTEISAVAGGQPNRAAQLPLDINAPLSGCSLSQEIELMSNRKDNARPTPQSRRQLVSMANDAFEVSTIA